MSDGFPIEFGRYKLVDRLAVGGMAELFLAEVTGAHGFQKTVVIKRILPHLGSDPQFTAMFIDEAKLTAKLSHPKIAQTYELGRHDDQLFIAMEYVEGLDTLAMLRECAHRRLRMPTDIAAHVVHEVLDALDFAHNEVDEQGELLGIVHRDISPSNVLVSKRGDVKLVDFGIAQALQSEQQTQAGTLKGKYGYMSPEQILGDSVDGRSDLFSVGVLLSEMLMGRRLFAAPTELDVLLMVRDVDLSRLERYGDHIDGELMAIARRALQKRPEDRFEDAATFRETLGDWLFENRLRVSSRRVSEFVASLYDDAWARRRTALEEQAEERAERVAGGASRVAAAGDGGGAHQSGVGSVGGLISGIPEGSSPSEFPPQDSGPEIHIAADAPNIAAHEGAAQGGRADGALASPAGVGRAGGDLALGEAQGEAEEPALPGSADGLGAGAGVAADDGGGGSPAGAEAAPSAAPREELDLDESMPFELDLDLDDLDEGAVPAADPSAAAPDAPASGAEGPQDRDAGVELDENSAGSDSDLSLDEVVAAPSPVPAEVSGSAEVSLRFSSIEAAVSSVSEVPREPAVREFDGSDLSRSPPDRPATREPAEHGAAAPPVPEEPPALQAIEVEPDSRGDFAATTPLHVLYRLAIAEATGLLVVEVGGVRKDIYFRDGDPEFVSSNVAGELFGTYLVSQQVIASGELDMALAMMPRYGGKLGDTLVGLGLMKPLDVFRHLSRQVRDKLIDVCTWVRGTYAWYESYENSRDAFPLDIDSFQVLGAGAMGVPEHTVLQWAELVAHRAPRLVDNPYLAPQKLSLPQWARRMMEALDGRQTVWELAGLYTADADRLSFLRVLRLFVECELAEFDRA